MNEINNWPLWINFMLNVGFFLGGVGITALTYRAKGYRLVAQDTRGKWTRG